MLVLENPGRFQAQAEDGDENARWWRFDPRVEWLIDTLKMLKQYKVLVICAHAETALSELNGIFALAEQMQAVDTTDVAPLSHPLAAIMALPLRLREDVVTEENRREAYQAPAPKTQDGLYLVPKVID